MTHWFTYTGGCTSAQANKLDALARAEGLGRDGGLRLFARAEACSIAKAMHRMSIKRADRAIAWAKQALDDKRQRKRWPKSSFH